MTLIEFVSVRLPKQRCPEQAGLGLALKSGVHAYLLCAMVAW